MNRDPVLPDVLECGLTTVFCGSAVGHTSARLGAYYARSGNRFWAVLWEAGFTDRRLLPAEYRVVSRYGLGLTDLAKHEYGNDSDLSVRAYETDALREKIERYRPCVLAFTAKAPARAFLREQFGCELAPGPEGYGPQLAHIGDTRLWVLPSTSGRARRFWRPDPWHRLARLHRALGRPAPAPPQP